MRNQADKSKAGGALSKERIVEAALAQIDRDGLAAFSLRDVARALGVYPTALYWHVPGRNDSRVMAQEMLNSAWTKILRGGSLHVRTTLDCRDHRAGRVEVP